MRVAELGLGVLLLEPPVFRDARGAFLESWREDEYRRAGIEPAFVQDNVSFSGPRVLRGLHYQYPRPQGKLVSVLEGRIFDVAVDIRRGSPTFGRWIGRELDGEIAAQLWIPPGLAHGFVVLSQRAVVHYKCTDYYAPAFDANVAWDDPEVGIEWPVIEPVLSPKDAGAPRLADIPPDRLPRA